MTALNMCISNTPLEFYPEYNLWVKREDLSCPGGPNFSKTRGVWAHMLARPDYALFGVLDTSHSQGGHAVARAGVLLGKRVRLYYPRRKADPPTLRPPQAAARDLGAELIELPAARSAILWHRARKLIEADGGYMFPNALKLPETVEETAKEVATIPTNILSEISTVIVSVSSGTIAAGVVRGLRLRDWEGSVILHLGYSRSHDAVLDYIEKASGSPWNSQLKPVIVDESYNYADEARAGLTPDFPCNKYYDLKAYRYWIKFDNASHSALLWNAG